MKKTFKTIGSFLIGLLVFAYGMVYVVYGMAMIIIVGTLWTLRFIRDLGEDFLN